MRGWHISRLRRLVVNLREKISYGLMLAFLAVVLRIVLAPFFKDVYNIAQWSKFTTLILDGMNPYSYAARNDLFGLWPYPPPLLGVTLYSSVLSFGNEALFLVLLKTPLIIADTLTGYLLYLIVTRYTKNVKFATTCMLLYLYNPLVLMVTSMQGEFDSIPIFFTVLAFYYSTSGLEKRSALSLGLAVAFKLYPVFLIPAFVSKMHSIKNFLVFCIIAALPLSVSSFPFLLQDYASYLNIVLNTGGGLGSFTIWNLYSYLGISQIPSVNLVLVIIVFLSLFLFMIKCKTSLLTNCLLSILSLYIFYPAIHENHYTWIIPFIIMGMYEDRKRATDFIYLPAFFCAVVYLGWGASGLFYWTAFWTGKWISLAQYVSYVSFIFPLLLYWLLVLIALGISSYYLLKLVRLKVSTKMHIQSNSRKTVVVLGVSLLCISTILMMPFSHSKFVLINSEKFKNLNGWTVIGDQKHASIMEGQGGMNAFVQLVSNPENFSYITKTFEMQNSVMISLVFQYKQIDIASSARLLAMYSGNFSVLMEAKKRNNNSFAANFTASNGKVTDITLDVNAKHTLNFYVIGERFIGIKELPLLRIIVELDNVKYLAYSTNGFLPRSFQMRLGVDSKTAGTNILDFYDMEVYRIKPLIVNNNIELEEQPIALVTIEIPVTLILIGMLLIDFSLHIQNYARLKRTL